jgi:hypothetical protein
MFHLLAGSLRRWRFSTAMLLSGLFVASSHAQSCGVASPSCLFGRPGLMGRIDRCSTIPPGALPMPNGHFVRSFQALQTHKAEADDFTIYYNEWFMGGMELGPFGLHHLGSIAKRLPECAHPVVIQPTGQGEVDVARQRKVIEMLLNAGVADAPNRVVLASPKALDLDGMEAPRIYQQMLTPQNSSGYGSFQNGNNFAGSLGGFGNLSGFGSGFGSGYGMGFGGRGLFGY